MIIFNSFAFAFDSFNSFNSFAFANDYNFGAQ